MMNKIGRKILRDIPVMIVRWVLMIMLVMIGILLAWILAWEFVNLLFFNGYCHFWQVDWSSWIRELL